MQFIILAALAITLNCFFVSSAPTTIEVIDELLAKNYSSNKIMYAGIGANENKLLIVTAWEIYGHETCYDGYCYKDICVKMYASHSSSKLREIGFAGNNHFTNYDCYIEKMAINKALELLTGAGYKITGSTTADSNHLTTWNLVKT